MEDVKGSDRGAGAVTVDEFESLKRQFHILEGERRAYFDTYEATKRQNEALIRTLRHENKEMRKSIAEMQREAALAGRMMDENTEISKERQRAARLRQEVDMARHESAKHLEQLEELKDEFNELQLEARQPAREETPLMRRIRQLENRLDKAMIKYNEAQSIKKTYEQIVRRLEQERLGFDTQVSAMERTLEARTKDTEELALLSNDASQARELALTELERAKQQYREDSRWREHELHVHEEQLRAARDGNERREQRQRERAGLHGRAEGDLSKEEEEALRASLAASAATNAAADARLESALQQVDVYEDAFRRIKEATGVADVNEVVQKILSQEDSQHNLMTLTHENQARIEQLLEHRAVLKDQVDRLKYAGPGGRTGARKLVDEHEEQLTAGALALERAKQKHERLAKALIQVKAGVAHLAAKLESVHSATGLSGAPKQLSDEAVVDVLFQCESALLNFLDGLSDKDKAALAAATPAAPAAAELRAAGAPSAAAGGKLGARSGSSASVGMSASRSAAASAVSLASMGHAEVQAAMESRPFNQRVAFGQEEEEGGEGGEAEESDGEQVLTFGEAEQESVSRDQVKRGAREVVESHVRSQRRRRAPQSAAGAGDGASPSQARRGARPSSSGRDRRGVRG